MYLLNFVLLSEVLVLIRVVRYLEGGRWCIDFLRIFEMLTDEMECLR